MTLTLRDIALLEHGSTISLTVGSGQSLCVVGPAASGKSKLLRIVGGKVPADRGDVQRPARVVVPVGCNRKLRPQDLSHKRGSNQAVHATEVLSQLRLWDHRQQVISDLAEPQIAACDLVEAFMGSGGLVVLDGSLDRLDPWTTAGAMRLIWDRCSHGAVVVASTNNLDLVSQFDHVIVLKDHQPVYAGSVSELGSKRGQRTLTVESNRNAGVRALVDPLLVGVSRTESGYKLEPGPGQDHAAKLLREGYGDVKFIVADQKAIAEIILGMIS
jgi:ABC-type multidrug transport system ATPase subunit